MEGRSPQGGPRKDRSYRYVPTRNVAQTPTTDNGLGTALGGFVPIDQLPVDSGDDAKPRSKSPAKPFGKVRASTCCAAPCRAVSMSKCSLDLTRLPEVAFSPEAQAIVTGPRVA